MAIWVGIGFDGTLADHSEEATHKIGRPLHPAIDMVHALLAARIAVKIFTHRASDPAQRELVAAWLKRQKLDRCEITNAIDADCRVLIDARAFRVEWNEGDFCHGCKHDALQQLRQIGLRDWPKTGTTGFMEFC